MVLKCLPQSVAYFNKYFCFFIHNSCFFMHEMKGFSYFLFYILERTKWTSPLQLPISLTHEGLVHFGAKRMSRSDNFPYAFLRIPTECFCFIGNPKEFLWNKNASLPIFNGLTIESLTHIILPGGKKRSELISFRPYYNKAPAGCQCALSFRFFRSAFLHLIPSYVW